jgi:tRNA uridine 5-carbamoylmethylation protein Kti12
MKKILIISIFFSLIYISCASQIFQIENNTYENESEKEVLQAFLVSNPPRDWYELVRFVVESDRNTISYAEARECVITRYYYRETWALNRNYEKGKPYRNILTELMYDDFAPPAGQDYRRHYKDALLSISYFIDDSGQYFYMIHLRADLSREDISKINERLASDGLGRLGVMKTDYGSRIEYSYHITKYIDDPENYFLKE